MTRIKKSESGIMLKAGMFAALMGIVYMAFNFFSNGTTTEVLTDNHEKIPTESHSANDNPPMETEEILPMPNYLPSPLPNDEVVQHKYYTLGYNETHEQADWVAYELTRKQLISSMVSREELFQPDPKVKTGSATPYDYKGSGYDRGHLCPAGDRQFSHDAMEETFYMSNMSPQNQTFNRGIWRELEENVRDWARKYKQLYITTGPILKKQPSGVIGKNEVSVPVSYYKVIYDVPNKKGIAFLIPNDVSDIPLDDYAVSIAKAEKVTGIDFFPNIIDDADVKDDVDLQHFNFDKARYKKRINEWNK